MRSLIRGLACGLALGLLTAAAGAVVRGAGDTFEDGTTNGWTTGAQSPLMPFNVADGGPAGPGDSYLQASASGLPGPGGRLVVIAGAQWLGNYVGAGVNAISMHVRNSGAADLSLRLFLAEASVGSGLTPAVVVQAGSGWQAVSFSLTSLLPNNASALPSMTAVTDLRLYHDVGSPGFPGEFLAAQLGIDNVTAVPEPAPAALLASGMGLLAGLSARRVRRKKPR